MEDKYQIVMNHTQYDNDVHRALSGALSALLSSPLCFVSMTTHAYRTADLSIGLIYKGHNINDTQALKSQH
jgi:hypothetical protein